MYDAFVAVGALLFVALLFLIVRWLFKKLGRASETFTAWGLSSTDNTDSDASQNKEE